MVAILDCILFRYYQSLSIAITVIAIINIASFFWKKKKTKIKKSQENGSVWLAQSIEHLMISALVMISGSWDGAQCWAPFSGESACLGSLCPSPCSYALSFSLSNKSLTKKSKKIVSSIVHWSRDIF